MSADLVTAGPAGLDLAGAEPAGGDPAGEATRGRGGLLASWSVLAVAQLALVVVDLTVVRTVVAAVTFLVLPALVLARRGRLQGDTRAGRALVAFGTSVLALMVVGLLLDLGLPVVGVSHPLAPVPLATAWFVLDAGLLWWRRDVALVRRDELREWWRQLLLLRVEAAPALGATAVVLSAAGAVRLNNGAGGHVAIAAVAVGVAALLALLVGGPASGTSRDTWTLWLVASALLLGTSLRGWVVIGHDVQAEYLVFRLADHAQAWRMSTLDSAYNACLSVTILPTIVVQATGLSPTFVFKVLVQLLFAVVPVLTYLTARRVVDRRLAVVAAVLTMAFPTFYTDMPYLVRQEVAFFFLALLLLVATDPVRRPRHARRTVVLLGSGVVLSHYSTTYVLLIGLVGALVLRVAAATVRRLRRGGPHDDGARAPVAPVLLHPAVVAVLLAGSLTWAGPITHTGGHARDVVRETLGALTGDAATGPGSSDTSYALVGGSRTSAERRMRLFVRETMDYRRREIPESARLVRHLGRAELAPRLRDQATAPPTVLGRALAAAGVDPVALDAVAKLAAAGLLQLLMLVGAWWVLRRGRRDPRWTSETVLVVLGSLAALGLIVAVPNLSVDYGALRAVQQTLLMTAPVLALGLAAIAAPLRRRAPRTGVAVVVGVPLLLMAVLTGIAPALVGGQQQRLALANAGVYYDRFWISDSEVQALSWLGAVDHADTTNARIIANRNIDVRLLGLSDNRAPVSDRLFPTLLTNDAYVFLDGQVVDKGTSTVFYTGDVLSYRYPTRDLDARLDLVYSAPHTRIYR